MNIKKINTSIPASFEYSYTDAEGVDQTDTINVKIKRISFRESVSKEFQEAFAKIQEDQAQLATVLCSILESWDITEDDDGKVPFEITPDNLLDNTSSEFIGQLAETVMGKLSPAASKTIQNS